MMRMYLITPLGGQQGNSNLIGVTVNYTRKAWAREAVKYGGIRCPSACGFEGYCASARVCVGLWECYEPAGQQPGSQAHMLHCGLATLWHCSVCLWYRLQRCGCRTTHPERVGKGVGKGGSTPHSGANLGGRLQVSGVMQSHSARCTGVFGRTMLF